MVTVINYESKKNTNGEVFYSLVIQSGIEMVKSQKTGQYYATVRRAYVPTTFDEATCTAMIGEKIPGQITKVKCEEYDYTNPDTGEVVKMNYKWEYSPDEPIPVKAFPNNTVGRIAKAVY